LQPGIQGPNERPEKNCGRAGEPPRAVRQAQVRARGFQPNQCAGTCRYSPREEPEDEEEEEEDDRKEEDDDEADEGDGYSE
jgi:hypothetical protein